MRIIEIEALYNGSHRNQESDQESDFETIPVGCAVVPDDMETPNYPFGEIEVDEIDGVMTVTKWTAHPIPEPEPVPEKEKPVTAFEQLKADVDYIAVMTGVEL